MIYVGKNISIQSSLYRFFLPQAPEFNANAIKEMQEAKMKFTGQKTVPCANNKKENIFNMKRSVIFCTRMQFSLESIC